MNCQKQTCFILGRKILFKIAILRAIQLFSTGWPMRTAGSRFMRVCGSCWNIGRFIHPLRPHPRTHRFHQPPQIKRPHPRPPHHRQSQRTHELAKIPITTRENHVNPPRRVQISWISSPPHLQKHIRQRPHIWVALMKLHGNHNRQPRNFARSLPVPEKCSSTSTLSVLSSTSKTAIAYFYQHYISKTHPIFAQQKH